MTLLVLYVFKSLHLLHSISDKPLSAPFSYPIPKTLFHLPTSSSCFFLHRCLPCPLDSLRKSRRRTAVGVKELCALLANWRRHHVAPLLRPFLGSSHSARPAHQRPSCNNQCDKCGWAESIEAKGGEEWKAKKQAQVSLLVSATEIGAVNSSCFTSSYLWSALSLCLYRT